MKLVVKAYATSEYGDSPSFAVVDVTPELVDNLQRLSAVCTGNDLSQVQTYDSPDGWDLQDDLRLRGDKLHVYGTGFFHYSAYPKHCDYRVETCTLEVPWLIELLQKGEHPYLKVIEGVAYYPDSEADDLRDMYIDAAEGEAEEE